MFVQKEDFSFESVPDEIVLEKFLQDKNFVVGLDFDGVFTDPFPGKTRALKRRGYDLDVSQSTRQECAAAGISQEDYAAASDEAYLQLPGKIPIMRGLLMYLPVLCSQPQTGVLIVTSRYDHMIPHMEEFLKYYKIRVDGVMHTNYTPKGPSLRTMGVDLYVDDDAGKLADVQEDLKQHGKKCTLLLYRHPANSRQSVPENVLEVDNWDELYMTVERRRSLSKS